VFRYELLCFVVLYVPAMLYILCYVTLRLTHFLTFVSANRRGIVDAGVVGGLTFGMLSILWLFLQAVFAGHIPDVDPCLPVSSSSSGSGSGSNSSSGAQGHLD
jgi:hypothetical protein